MRERFRWDIRHRSRDGDGVDAPLAAHDWLVGVCNARVNVRMLHLVRAGLVYEYGIIIAVFCIDIHLFEYAYLPVQDVRALSKCRGTNWPEGN